MSDKPTIASVEIPLHVEAGQLALELTMSVIEHLIVPDMDGLIAIPSAAGADSIYRQAVDTFTALLSVHNKYTTDGTLPAKQTDESASLGNNVLVGAFRG